MTGGLGVCKYAIKFALLGAAIKETTCIVV
jgi:hypothetical protein